jgi:hypothetical protein
MSLGTVMVAVHAQFAASSANLTAIAAPALVS